MSKARLEQRPNRRSWLVAGLILCGVAARHSEFQLPQFPTPYAVCSSSNDVYTVDEALPRVECIAVNGDLIVDTGRLADVIHRAQYVPFPEAFRVMRDYTGWDLLQVHHLKHGSILLPGLADAHGHVIQYGMKVSEVQLDESQSVEEVVSRIKKYITSHPETNDTSQWIKGWGWDQTKWEGRRFPTADDLARDPLLQGRLIHLSRIDGHASWVSPSVLELMGELPTEVEGGIISRDKDGNPDGIFFDNAMYMVPVPPMTEKQMSHYFDAGMRDALAHGLTSIHDAAASIDMIKLFKRKAEEGVLPMRLYLMGYAISYDYEDWISKWPRLINYGKQARLTLRAIKLFTDGALGSWGAALLEPYSDDPQNRGIMRATDAKLRHLARGLWKDGWQINVHCIGDRANHVVLDIFEEIINDSELAANVSERRPRIEHAQIFTPGDLERIAKLGVIASVQPTHATSDMWYAEDRLGPERIKSAYAYRTLLENSPNKVLPLGSDFPVEGINPLLGFYAATSRLSQEGTSPHGDGGWYSRESLTREQALKGMTLDAAYASFAESTLGSLTPGKKADFVILDRNIMTIPYHEILETKVIATVIDGTVAYGGL